MIKAIDTKYANHLFRSRLEARYAVYFDALNVKWVYEHEGFDFGGERYLPDFYFPKYKLYAEIKQEAFSYNEHKKCRLLANMTGKKVIELVGLPSTDMSCVITPLQTYMCPIYGEEYVYDDPRSKICKCGVKHRITKTLMEGEGVLTLISKKDSYKPIFYGEYCNDDASDIIMQNAIRKATEARFEFGHKNI
jgi:hypothetical protein